MDNNRIATQWTKVCKATTIRNIDHIYGLNMDTIMTARIICLKHTKDQIPRNTLLSHNDGSLQKVASVKESRTRIAYNISIWKLKQFHWGNH